MTSIFTVKKKKPEQEDLRNVLGTTYGLWQNLVKFVKTEYTAAGEEWNFSNPKYGWNFRLRDKKRVIIYLQPRNKFFMASFVFGQKATEEIMRSVIADDIKTELTNAKVYAEGRGIRVGVRNKKILKDLQLLIKIKLAG